MNKRLLLILSILMSLSLFAMSCAKSVTAPKTVSVNVIDISNVGSSIVAQGVIIKDGNVELNLSDVRYGIPENIISLDYSSITPVVFNQNSILKKLTEFLQSISYYANGVSSIAVVSDWTIYSYSDDMGAQSVDYYAKAQAVGKYGEKLEFTFVLKTSGNIDWQ